MNKPIALLGWLAAALLCSAQSEAPTEAIKDEIDLPARRQSVETMREHIGMRQARLDEVVKELKKTGDGIDQRIGRITTSLANMKDSQSSKTRISMLKGSAANELMGLIERYQIERRRLVEQAKKDGHAPIESIAAIVRHIDERVNKRAADVVKLVDSIPGAKDVKKYTSSGRYGNGWGWTSSRISDTWRQNRRDGIQSKKKRNEAQKALDESIADLERRRDRSLALLKRTDLTEVEREIQQFELDHVNSVIEIRREQLFEVTKPPKKPNQSISRNEADDMKALFKDAIDQLGADFNDNLRLYYQAKEENEKLFKLKTNLEAREKWLTENDPDWKGGK